MPSEKRTAHEVEVHERPNELTTVVGDTVVRQFAKEISFQRKEINGITIELPDFPSTRDIQPKARANK